MFMAGYDGIGRITLCYCGRNLKLFLSILRPFIAMFFAKQHLKNDIFFVRFAILFEFFKLHDFYVYMKHI